MTDDKAGSHVERFNVASGAWACLIGGPARLSAGVPLLIASYIFHTCISFTPAEFEPGKVGSIGMALILDGWRNLHAGVHEIKTAIFDPNKPKPLQKPSALEILLSQNNRDLDL